MSRIATEGVYLELIQIVLSLLGPFFPKWPDVWLGSTKVGVTGVDLSSVIEPPQGYLLSCDSEGNFFTDP